VNSFFAPLEYLLRMVMRVGTFVGAEEVEELIYLRDQNRQLIKLIAELKVENRRLRRQFAKLGDDGARSIRSQ